MYNLNTSAARDADNISSFLKDSGKYKGMFTRAESLISKKGTKGIGFTFEDESKRTTKFDLWTLNDKGEELPSFKHVMAIMTCLRVKTMSPSKAIVDRYDYDTKKTEKVEAEVFADLMNKPIGLVLRNTEYEKMKDGAKTGDTRWRLELYTVFDSNEFTASEVLDKKTTPEKLAVAIASLQDKPLKGGDGVKPQANSASDVPAFFDDIGF